AISGREVGGILEAQHQTEVAKAALDRSLDDLAKTVIVSPLDGTISKLNSQKGERVVGTATMAGTEVMAIADLETMEARVDIGEGDIVLIQVGQIARLEVDSFRDRKFTGEVTEIANTAKASGLGTQQEATKFEVRIRVKEKEIFRPGMSVTAEVETRYRTNVLCVPIQSVTTRLPKSAQEKEAKAKAEKADAKETYSVAAKKKDEPAKPIEVIFQRTGETVKQVPVKRGISDDNFVEIIEGVTEGAEVISGGFKAINRELEDGKQIKVDNEKKPAETGK
ncbi:MAG: HlyD family efflux transporter periplasmic adaptor subunit, partial [Verrucomicrobia bacterium]|nr:HlyD family efflux transporter periplasmic adaptor subunit [Verrucomicrobiota bacterium]